MALIEVQDLKKTYTLGEVVVPVLRGVNLSIAAGEYVALMGASGSGKSTLMNILGCLDRPTSGRYLLEGADVAHLSSDQRALIRNRQFGFVFQSFNLLPRTSALENVALPLTYSDIDISDAEARLRATEMLGLVGLGDRLDHVPSQLSGGQQQRVAIARALVNRPTILFADEPTGNLDSRTSDEVMKLFTQLNRGQGITILMVTHEADVATRASRTVRMKDGHIEGDDRVSSTEIVSP